MEAVENDANLLREAADRLSTGTPDLTGEYPDLDACVADLMRKHATVLEWGGCLRETPRLIAQARQIMDAAA